MAEAARRRPESGGLRVVPSGPLALSLPQRLFCSSRGSSSTPQVTWCRGLASPAARHGRVCRRAVRRHLRCESPRLLVSSSPAGPPRSPRRSVRRCDFDDRLGVRADLVGVGPAVSVPSSTEYEGDISVGEDRAEKVSVERRIEGGRWLRRAYCQRREPSTSATSSRASRSGRSARRYAEIRRVNSALSIGILAPPACVASDNPPARPGIPVVPPA